MVVTLEWIRDKYDNNPKNRFIDESEKFTAFVAWTGGEITMEEWTAVLAAYDNHILLPEYGTPVMPTPNVTSFNIPSGSTLQVDGVEVI